MTVYSDEVAERATIGLLLRGSPGCGEILRGTDPDTFTVKECRKVFELVRDAHLSTGKIPGKKRLEHQLERSGEPPGKVKKYVALLKKIVREAADSKEDLRYWVDRLEERAIGRRVMRVIDWGEDGESSVLDLMEQDKFVEAAEVLEKAAFKIRPKRVESRRGDYLDTFEERRQTVIDMRRNPEKYAGVGTGIGFVDKRTGGMRRQRLGILSAESGVGKTSAMAAMAKHAWQQGLNVFVATIEEPFEEFNFKLDSAVASLNSEKFLRAHEGYFEDGDAEVWEKAIQKERHRGGGRTNKLWVADFPNYVSVADLEAAIDDDETKLGKKFDCVFIDHLGLVTPSGFQAQEGVLDWKSQAVATYQCKFLARRRRMVVWLMVQDRIEKQGKKSKGLARIGASYLIGQAADLAIGMTQLADRPDGILAIDIIKGRYSAKGGCVVHLDHSTCTFRDPPREEDGEDEDED